MLLSFCCLMIYVLFKVSRVQNLDWFSKSNSSVKSWCQSQSESWLILLETILKALHLCNVDGNAVEFSLK